MIKPLQVAYYWLIEPKSNGSDARRREFILNVLLVGSLVLSSIALLIVLINQIIQPSRSVESPLTTAIPVVLFLAMTITSRRGFSVVVAYTLVSLYFLLAFYTLLRWGISLSIGTLVLALVLVMSSILIGTRFAAILTFLSVIVLIGLGALQHSNTLSFDADWMNRPGDVSDAIIFSFTLAVLTTVSWLSNREIERFNATLQGQVRKATEHLRSANKKLKVLDKTKDEFLSMASHQLGTPLTAITGYLSMALDNDQKNMTAAQREYIQYALESAERMGAMTQDLLNVSRLNAGKFVIRQEPADLVAIARSQVETLQASADRKGLALKFEAPESAKIMLDISKTTQVVMNLIDNALYYTEKGSVTVKVEQRQDTVAFTVTDTGMGVPADERSKLFSKFYRAVNAKSARPDGTGLGLYLAKKVVEEQGGSIIFESEVGKGSTFGFKLPIKGSGAKRG